MQSINNAAPGVVDYGAQDKSGAVYVRTPEELPQHLPKFLIYAKKGTTDEQLLDSTGRIAMYGEDTFVERSPFFNHATMLSNAVNSRGNSAMYVRLVPDDAGPKPTSLLSLDVLPTKVDIYERNEDGSIKTDVAGDAIVIGQADGFRVKFVNSYFDTVAAAEAFGARTITTGDQVDTTTNTQSQRYPIFDAEHSFFGSDGQLAGWRLWGQNSDNTGQLPTKMMSRNKAFPYNLSIIRKDADTGTSSPVETLYGEKIITVTFKEDVIDPLTTTRLNIGERFAGSYQDLKTSKYAKKYGEFGRFKVYQDNINALLKLFHTAEVPFLTEDSDMTADEGDIHLFNFITGQDTTGRVYDTYQFTDNGNAVRLSSSTNVFAAGGGDGTMTVEKHAAMVSSYMKRYASRSDELNDIAWHVESHIYDSGFPLENKYDLLNFIANRKDTFVALSTMEFGQRDLTLAEEFSVAAALFSRAALHPESTYFATPVFRAMIMNSAGQVFGSQYTENFPMTYELAYKSAKYMGAGNGKWKSGENMDGFPGHIVETQFGLINPWVEDDVRNRFWDVGLNFIARYDRSSFYLPALKTVYDDDTSVLTSYITACAIIQLNKIAHKAQRRFSGVSGLTMAQFNKKVNDFIEAEVLGRFDDRFVIKPRCQFTSMDQVRNFSWTLPIDIAAPGMRTVMTTYTTAYRIESYQAD